MSDVIGHRLHGEGPTKVMVFHGWFGDHHAFDPMLPAIDGARFSYAFVDQRGYGASKARPGPFTLEQVAADGLALADSLGWKEFHVVGHSMGAAVAQRIAADAKSRVSSVILLTGVPASGVPLDEDGHGLFYGAPESDENCRGIIDFTTGNRLTGAWLDMMVAHTRASCTREAFAAYLEAWQKADFADAVRGLAMPMLAVVGEHDPALNADVMNGTVMTWFENATLETVPNAGHYPMQETPMALAAIFERFFTS